MFKFDGNPELQGIGLGSSVENFDFSAAAKKKVTANKKMAAIQQLAPVIQDSGVLGSKDSTAGGALTGAASGAAAGAAFGPYGAAIGGVIGGASGALSAKSAQKARKRKAEAAFHNKVSTIEGSRAARQQQALSQLQASLANTLR